MLGGLLMTKKNWMVLGISVMIILVIGVSYAYWHVTKSQEEINQIASGCLDIELVSNSKEIKLENAYPILNSEGVKLAPYTFTITNTCSIFLSYELTLNMLLESTLNSRYIAAVLDQNNVKKLSEYEEVEPLTGYQESRVLQRGFLASNESETYDLRLWMDESVTIEDTAAMNTIFQGKIAVTAVPSQYRTLADTILQNEYPSLSVEQAKNEIKRKEEPDFTKIAPTISWQEKHESNTVVVKPELPHPDKVGEYQGFTKIEQSYVRLSNGYTFDPETGKYTLTDSFLVDPTTITDYDTKNYYYCYSFVAINKDDVMNIYQTYQNCNEIYKVVSVTKENKERTGPSGKIFQLIQYNITGNRYYQMESDNDPTSSGLYMAMDDHGESYYYRGNVHNNYVKFAGFYWRIIRLNGDGSIRLLYAGDSPTADGTSLLIDPKKYMYNVEHNSPANIGYMYGNDQDIYENITKNENDSVIKQVLDEWYQKNILEKGYSNRVADSIFCNDREIYSGDGISNLITSGYKTYRRYAVEKNPSYFCQQMNDRFTVSEKKGNGALTYPIGLITVDELHYAGMAKDSANRFSYIYSSENYLTMSPVYFAQSDNGSIGTAYVFRLDNSGNLMHSVTSAQSGVRAVLNLKSNVVVKEGIGTADDPFIVA
jgi:hypothetical protein